ncbi:hypothetical protein RUM43_005784 [Polyplax serrata]|uniref:carbonic anhydrase n=1 Tax=Polyplax serrata TaxID=468196 RepID=A0AAN8PA24_POLSC
MAEEFFEKSISVEPDDSTGFAYLSGYDERFCGGKMQSPINIKLSEVTLTKYSPFRFDPAYVHKQKFVAKNTGHTVQLFIQNPSIKPKIFGGGLKGEYIFEQLHFHWESEHLVDGKRADLEMHMVHYNAKYPSMAKALNNTDGVVVLAVFFDRTETRTAARDELFDFINDTVIAEENYSGYPESNFADFDFTKSGTFALRDLLPRHLGRFFRYFGSLTTPNYNEVVQWTAFINRLYVSSDILTALKTIRDRDNLPITSNFRPPLALYGRKVYAQMTDDEILFNSGTKQKFSIYLLFLVVFTSKLGL